MIVQDVISREVKGVWGNPPQEGATLTPVIKTNNMSYEGYISFDDLTYRDIPVKKLHASFLQKGDLLIEKSGGTKTHSVGYVNIFENENDTYVCNNFIFAIRPDVNIILPKYLFFQLKYMYETGQFSDCYNKTTGIQNLKTDRYLAKSIKCPTKSDQQKIISALDNIEQGIKVKQEQLKALDELIQSRFMQSFEYNKLYRLGTLYTLSQLCKVFSSKRIYQKEQKSSGIPFFRVADLVSKIETNNANAELFISISMYQELKKQGYVPSEGDILVTTRGTLGKCYIVSKKDDFYFQDGMISWLKDFSSQISSRYLAYAFAMPQIQNQIKSIQGKGATVSFLSLAMLKQLEILVPPIEQQKKFLEFVQQVERAKEIVKMQVKDLQELLALKMDEYFK